jgi:mycothiol synthase
MDQPEITIIPADPDDYFAAIAELMNSVESEPNTAESVSEWYHKQPVDDIRFAVAFNRDSRLVGFNGIYRLSINIERYYGTYLVVERDYWGQGAGSRLYTHLLSQAAAMGARTLRARVRDDCQPGINFALKRGFEEKKHSIEMVLDLDGWDDQQYAPIRQSVQEQGFQFTSMAELGDTPEARRKLFALNNSAAATDPSADNIPPWSSFEEFERDVCQSNWYHPDAQIIAIDTTSGNWAAMSAITVFAGSDHAYNLFTGTDVRYRGRKLAQAVKSQALTRARDFGVHYVRTNHNTENTPMIAIDEKLGYVRVPGFLVMEKELENG